MKESPFLAHEAYLKKTKKPRFVATAEVLDRDQDIVRADGLANLEQFNKNPVLLWMHDVFSPIGTVSDYKVHLDGKTPFHDFAPEFSKSKRNELALLLKDLVGEGVIRASSIRFEPVELEEHEDEELRGVVVKRWNLLETSLVTIPANQDALMEAAMKHKSVAKFAGQLRLPPWICTEKARTLWSFSQGVDQTGAKAEQKPVPSPTADESRQEFMNRCMSDEAMTEEFPDAEQRGGVCATAYEEAEEKAEKVASGFHFQNLKDLIDFADRWRAVQMKSIMQGTTDKAKDGDHDHQFVVQVDEETGSVFGSTSEDAGHRHEINELGITMEAGEPAHQHAWLPPEEGGETGLEQEPEKSIEREDHVLKQIEQIEQDLDELRSKGKRDPFQNLVDAVRRSVDPQ